MSMPAPRLAVRTATSILTALLLVLLMSPQAAMADDPSPLTVTSTTTTAIPPNATTPLAGVGVSGLTTDTTVQVTMSTDRGTLSIGTTSGLDLAYGNNWADTASVTFSGNEADVNAGLATLTLTTGNDTGTAAAVTITAQPSAPGVVYSPTNQHFYQFIADEGVSADDAREEAKTQDFLGQPGYLATINDADINELVSQRIEGASNVWFGARSIDTFDNVPARTWVWGDGPLADKPITECTYVTGSGTEDGRGCDFVNDEGRYSSWAPGEPNNCCLDYNWLGEPIPHSGEWVAVTNWGGGRGNWNDLPAQAGFYIAGYVVEYGDLPVGATSFPGVVSATTDVQIVRVPDAPTNVSAVAGNAMATVSFLPPASDGGSMISGYTVTSIPDGITKSCTASPCDVAGLTNGIGYTFTVRATNANGDSDPSDPSNEVTPATVPDAPTNFAVTVGDISATATFTPAADDGGAPVVSYTLTAQPGGLTKVCASSPCVITKLQNGVAYSFTLHATNAVGNSVEAEGPTGTPVGAPGKPTAVTATRGDGSATVQFLAPADDGGSPITSYLVTSAPGGITSECPKSPCVITGLTNGTEYQLTVTAINEVGLSETSNPSDGVTPATVPGAPAKLTADRGNGSVALTFLAPNSSGGSAITRYEVSLDGGDTWQTLTVTGSAPITATVLGLSNGTPYDLEVRAVNEVGPGLAAGRSGVTPARQPSAPTGVSATRGDKSATVAFTAPAANGAAITDYTITSSPGGHSVTCSVSPCVVDGLTNGTDYTFTVLATNAVGDSDASDPSNSVTPAGKPSAPVLQSVTSTSGSLLLSFVKPDSDGGAEILGYDVTTDGGDTWGPITTSGTSPLTATITGLTNGTEYAVQVRARNVIGAGSASSSRPGTPATVPSEPRSVLVHVAAGRVEVSWTAPSSNGGSAITRYVATASPGGQTCANTTTSCAFVGLPTGVTYTFSVVAVNLVDGRSGTGTGPAGTSAPVPVTGLPGAPRTLAVTPGDRVLGLTFTPPASDGGSVVTSYQVSTDGGATWATVPTKGSTNLSATVAPVLNGKSFGVQVRARNLNGSGPATATVTVATKAWFSDPVSSIDRKAEVAVPKSPASYRGPLRHTVATYKSANGTIAYPGTGLKGRQLQGGQAVDMAALFANGSAKLTTAGTAQVKAVVTSLRYVSQITCEGYADYGGSVSTELKLSKARATTVCEAIKGYAKQVTSRTITAYGSARPAILSSNPSDRAANRRVVVLVRG